MTRFELGKIIRVFFSSVFVKKNQGIINELNLNTLKISVISAHNTCPICFRECLYGAREAQSDGG